MERRAMMRVEFNDEFVEISYEQVERDSAISMEQFFGFERLANNVDRIKCVTLRKNMFCSYEWFKVWIKSENKRVKRNLI